MTNEVEERAKLIEERYQSYIPVYKGILSEDVLRKCAQADIDWFISHGYRKVKPANVPENPFPKEDREQIENTDTHKHYLVTNNGCHIGYNQAISDFQSLNNGLFTEDK